MIPIFDLDDTLYPERSFVESGFRSVAIELEDRYGWPQHKSMKKMLDTLANKGRGLVFDELLKSQGMLTSKNVKKCLNTYRTHQPNIHLNKGAELVIRSLNTRPYLVTDGHKLVQHNKIRALGITSLFAKIYITHRYGIKNAKPSIYCFELIRKQINCDWNDMFYVGDNPYKDFVNLNKLGVHTIRVRTGEYADLEAQNGFDAIHSIDSMEHLPKLLEKIFHE